VSAEPFGIGFLAPEITRVVFHVASCLFIAHMAAANTVGDFSACNSWSRKTIPRKGTFVSVRTGGRQIRIIICLNLGNITISRFSRLMRISSVSVTPRGWLANAGGAASRKIRVKFVGGEVALLLGSASLAVVDVVLAIVHIMSVRIPWKILDRVKWMHSGVSSGLFLANRLVEPPALAGPAALLALESGAVFSAHIIRPVPVVFTANRVMVDNLFLKEFGANALLAVQTGFDGTGGLDVCAIVHGGEAGLCWEDIMLDKIHALAGRAEQIRFEIAFVISGIMCVDAHFHARIVKIVHFRRVVDAWPEVCVVTGRSVGLLNFVDVFHHSFLQNAARE